MLVTRYCAFCGKEFVTGGRHGRGHKQRFCSHQCAQRAQFTDAITRFWSNVKKGNTPDECWLWTGSQTSGYGTFHGALNKLTLAHRFSYELYHGPIPEGLFVCHHCDSRACVNPAHLFLGTNHDNAIDAAHKGRMAKGKLTIDDVRTIREMHAAGARGCDLAQRFGVSQGLISAILTGRSWKHV